MNGGGISTEKGIGRLREGVSVCVEDVAGGVERERVDLTRLGQTGIAATSNQQDRTPPGPGAIPKT